jgi:DNA-directed RNA polymerase subunit H (RpoH/RPB5)
MYIYDYQEDFDLTDEEAATLHAVLKHKTRQEAAEALDISRMQLWRRLQEEPVARALEEIQGDAKMAASARLMRAAENASHTLEEIAESPETPAYTRVNACRALLDYAYKVYEYEEVDAKIEELEERLR